MPGVLAQRDAMISPSFLIGALKTGESTHEAFWASVATGYNQHVTTKHPYLVSCSNYFGAMTKPNGGGFYGAADQNTKNNSRIRGQTITGIG